jgi:2,3-bisphosphoglycerate-dependent phosphoglycerate mutase
MRCSCSLASPRWRSQPHQAAEAGALFLPITTAAARANNHRRSVSTLILLRHGQSQWNGPDSRFTGWCDIPLTVRGRVEAVAAGQLMRSRGFKARRVCIAFASDLQRSHETCELALASMAGHEQNTWSSERIRRDWRLNERHYGAVQGKFKEDPQLIAEYGTDTIHHWRRSLHGKPPPMDESHPYYQPPPAPLTESLADCQKRVLECWEDSIAPALFEEQGLPFSPDKRAIVVVAHANTIRSLMAHFDQVPEDRIPKLHVPNSVPILYRFETSTRQPISVKLESAHGGSHARWMLSAENNLAVRQAVQQGGTLTRALFDAMGANKDLTISGKELEMGVRELLRHGDHPVDCVVLGVAQRVARKLSPDDVIHISEFEKLCQEGVEGLSLKHLNPNDYVSEEYGVY